MRKTLAALVVGTLVLGQAISAVAATAKPAAPAPAATKFGQINNRAVLGLVALQGSNETCTPKSPEDKSCEATNNGGLNDGDSTTLPVILGAGAAGIAIAAAAGGGGGKGPSSP